MGYVSGFQGLTDGQMKVSFTAKELESTDFSTVHQLQANTADVYCTISTGKPSKEHMEAVQGTPAPSTGHKAKTPSQRLRGAYYGLWSKGDQKEDFSQWYNRKIEGHIAEVKYEIEQLKP